MNVKVEPRPSSESQPDPAAVLLHDVADDRQAQARPAARPPGARPVDLVEALEDPRPVAPRDADAAVRHRRLEHVVAAPDADQAPRRRPG